MIVFLKSFIQTFNFALIFFGTQGRIKCNIFFQMSISMVEKTSLNFVLERPMKWDHSVGSYRWPIFLVMQNILLELNSNLRYTALKTTTSLSKKAM